MLVPGKEKNAICPCRPRKNQYHLRLFRGVVSSAVEQLAFNQLVDGSNPSRPTMIKCRKPRRTTLWGFLFCAQERWEDTVHGYRHFDYRAVRGMHPVYPDA
jgi:hypothetical protein